MARNEGPEPFDLLKRGCRFGARNEFSGSGETLRVLPEPFLLLDPSFIYLERSAFLLSKC